MERDMKTIRAAIEAHCGGWKGKSDAAIRAKWDSLPADIRSHYLANDKPTQMDPQNQTETLEG